MKRKHLLLTLLMALAVPLATWAQIQSTDLGPNNPSYETDFQTLTDWIPHNDNTNGWCIDNAIYRTLPRSLYATATPAPGSSHPEYYVVGDNETYSYMTRLFFMEAGAYQIEYFYIGGRDYLYNISPSPRVALVEGEQSFLAGHNMNYSIGDSPVIYIDHYIDNSNPNIPLTRILPYASTWTRITETVVIPENGFYTLVFALEIPFGLEVGYAWKMGFDDLSIQYIEPYDLAFTDINHQSAKLTWKSINADSWEVQYRRTSPTTTEWVHRTGLTGRSCTLNNLPTLADATTNFEVQVRANFSDGVNSAWVTTQFAAPRTPNMTYPYTTNFEIQSDDADWCITPTSFRQSNELGYCTETFGINVVSEPENVLNNRCLHVWNSLYDETRLNYFPENPNAGMLSYAVCFAKKSFNFSRGDYSLVFDWAGKGEGVQSISTIHSTGDFLHVFLAPIGADLDNIMERKLKNHLGTEGVIPITDLQKNAFTQGTFSTTFSIDTETAGEYLLVFAWVNDLICNIPYERYAFAVDNLTLDLTTTFPLPTDLAVSPSANSATFSWTGQESASSYTIQYKEASASSWTTVTPDTNPYTLTGLTNNTNYVAQLRINYDNNTNHSEWAAFDPFRTLMQDVVALHATNTSYFEDFESGSGDWAFINASTNKWKRFSYNNQFNGNQGYGLRVTSSADNTLTPSWIYTTRKEYTINGQSGYLGTPATSYAVKTFSLSEGHYEFTYRYAVKGVANEDYMRVVLVPAETVIEAGTLPNGFDYQNTPAGWFSLDHGHQLTGYSANYYHWQQQTNITLDVYPGSTIEPGNYMIVVLWHNPGAPARDGQNPPGAIDNVSVTWSELLTPPDMNTLVVTESDTQTELIWNVPNCGLTPTSYEVEYDTINSFTGALTASTEMNGIMLMGLTPHTSYFVRIRSAYTANGTTIYSDWSDARAFSTLYPRPTDLAVVDQTTSWARITWTAVVMELEEGQRLNYSYQLTTNAENWGEINDGVAGDCNELNLAPGTYYYRLMTKVYDNTNTIIGTSDWTDPIEFTIAPWSDPVTIFPLTYGFEENRFVDGITLGGNLDKFDFYSYYNAQDQLPAHDGGESGRLLGFMSGTSSEAYMVLPPLRPSTNDALVSFWWYHDSSNTNASDGVIVEQSNDGSSWTPFGTLIQRYAAESGWVKYNMVVPAPTSCDKVYVRLHFYGANNNQWWKRCYLDDLTVNNFKSYQPYISYVAGSSNSATLTIYDYNYQMGWLSSAFEVQYREYREPGETQEEWITYPQFNEENPAFEHDLVVNGLHPATYYEFQVRAYVTYGQFTFPASEYSTPYRQWTDCGTYTITPSYSYTEDFEELFNGTDCWTVDEGWTMQQSGGYNSSYCAYVPAGAYNNRLTSPEINFDGCDNVIMRFWTKGAGYVRVRYGENMAQSRLLYSQSNAADWVQVEVSLSYFMDKAPIQIYFEPITGVYREWYVDDIEIVANVYDKVFDVGGYSYAGEFTANSLWYPSGAPTAEDEVMVMATARVGLYETSVSNAVVGTVRFSSCGSLLVNPLGTLTANEINATKTFTVKGTANVTTLNPGAANSVVVKYGGTLYAGTITGTSLSATDKVVVEDGGQLKTDHEAFATIKKNIDSYTEVEQQNNVERGGYYLVSSPLHSDFINPAQGGMVTYVEEDGEVVWNYDLYAFNYEYEGAEWRNYKDDDFLMEVGRGYLYANRDGVELSFAGRIAANDTPVYIGTSYSQGGTYDFNGWKLVGNPFTCDAYITDVSAPDCMSFYRMNPTGSGFIAATGAIKPMEGIFLRSTMSAQAFGFSRDDNSNVGSKLCFNLNQGNVLVDNAIIRFGEGGTLAKFSFNNNTSKVYFPQKGSNYAVVSSHPVGELPLNFEAVKDGTYTLSVNIDEAELLYCHLIDNKTGADVNLLETPEYTFSAKVDDYASRFKVVFVAASEDADGDSESFAFNSNGNWIIANEGRATLQVIDLNGRMLSSQQIEGCAETRINAAPGLYMIRLINGENVRVQKVVVR